MIFISNEEIDRNEAKQLVIKYHYSHRPPANVQYVGGYKYNDELIATSFFSIPPTRWAEDLIELSRLVRKDDVKISLTSLISKCLKELKKKDFDLIVSYADSTQDHHGGIYQAASWNYHGFRKKSIDGNLINGKFIPRRTCNSIYGTSSYKKLSELLNTEVVPHYDKGKYLYWKALSRSGEIKAKRLKLEINQYPKPIKV